MTSLWWSRTAVLLGRKHHGQMMENHQNMMTSWNVKCFPHYWPFVIGGFFLQRARNTKPWRLCCVSLNKLLNLQSSCLWIETPWHSCHFIIIFQQSYKNTEKVSLHNNFDYWKIYLQLNGFFFILTHVFVSSSGIAPLNQVLLTHTVQKILHI